MIPEDEKTPAILPHEAEIQATMRASTPPLPRRGPPPGRPAGALSISELVERITERVTAQVTRDAHARAEADLERARRELHAEVAAEVRTATWLGVAAVALNIVAFAVLAVAHAFPGRVLGVALGGLTIVLVAFVASIRSREERGTGRRTTRAVLTSKVQRFGVDASAR